MATKNGLGFGLYGDPSNEPTDFLLEFSEGAQKVVIDDDGRVAYAYLLVNEEPSGLVWLYNRLPAPSLSAEWQNAVRLAEEESPLNAFEYIRDEEFRLPSGKDFGVVWHPDIKSVAIYLRDELFAVLKEGANPGWSLLAKIDGPLAKDLLAALPPD